MPPPTERSTEERHEALLRLVQNLSLNRDPSEVLQVVASDLRLVLDFDYVSLFLNDECGNRTRCYELTPEGQSILAPSPESMPEYPLAAWVLEHQQPALIPGGETRLSHGAEFLSQRGVQSACAVPVTANQRRLGTMVVARKRADGYSDAEARFISLVAGHLALGIDNALKFEALQIRQAESERSGEQLKLILDVNNRIASNLDLQELLRSISASVRSAVQCDFAAVSVPDPETNQLRVFALVFPDSRGFAMEGFLIPLDGTPIGEAFKLGKPAVNVRVHDARADANAAASRTQGIRLGCSFPLFNRGRKLGVLSVGRRDVQPFGQNDLDLLSQVVNQVVIALDNAMAYGQIAELRDQLNTAS